MKAIKPIVKIRKQIAFPILNIRIDKTLLKFPFMVMSVDTWTGWK